MPRRMEASLSRGNWFQATGVPGSGVEKGILGCSRNRQTEEKLGTEAGRISDRCTSPLAPQPSLTHLLSYLPWCHHGFYSDHTLKTVPPAMEAFGWSP